MSVTDEKLDSLLKGFVPVPPSKNLAERIIAEAAASQVSARIESNKKSLFRQILNSLIIPQPAYALACSMLVGVLLGWQNSGVEINTTQIVAVEEDLSSLFIAEVSYYE